jgi:hypothetical protein
MTTLPETAAAHKVATASGSVQTGSLAPTVVIRFQAGLRERGTRRPQALRDRARQRCGRGVTRSPRRTVVPQSREVPFVARPRRFAGRAPHCWTARPQGRRESLTPRRGRCCARADCQDVGSVRLGRHIWIPQNLHPEGRQAVRRSSRDGARNAAMGAYPTAHEPGVR